MIGRRSDAELTRFVESFVALGEPVDFRALCERAVPTSTRFVVLDLDRTLHLGRNMGELLGWEICAYLSYGRAYLDELEGARVGGRMYLETSRPLGLLRYVHLAARHWGPPGLFYLLWGKLAWRHPALRRRSYLRFGPEPVRAVQSIPQHALLHRIATLPLATVHELAGRVWKRYRPDQTIEREDLEWLRRRCPGVRIVISSASPQPTLEVSAEALGVDDIFYSSLEEHGGRLSAPCDLRRLARAEASPHRFTPPSKARINTGRAKLAELFARYPELRAPDLVSVGISDTGYGEDHCWSEAFTHLVDVNSSSPFPPIVPADARVRTICSAGLLTRREKDARAAGQPDYLDPRRAPLPVAAELGHAELAARLADERARIEALSAAIIEAGERLAGERAACLDQVAEIEAALEHAVEEWNRSDEQRRAELRRQLSAQQRRRDAVTSRLARVERPVSELVFRLTRALEQARAKVSQRP
jgi:hypothetical protein